MLLERKLRSNLKHTLSWQWHSLRHRGPLPYDSETREDDYVSFPDVYEARERCSGSRVNTRLRLFSHVADAPVFGLHVMKPVASTDRVSQALGLPIIAQWELAFLKTLPTFLSYCFWREIPLGLPRPMHHLQSILEACTAHHEGGALADASDDDEAEQHGSTCYIASRSCFLLLLPDRPSPGRSLRLVPCPCLAGRRSSDCRSGPVRRGPRRGRTRRRSRPRSPDRKSSPLSPAVSTVDCHRPSAPGGPGWKRTRCIGRFPRSALSPSKGSRGGFWPGRRKASEMITV